MGPTLVYTCIKRKTSLGTNINCNNNTRWMMNSTTRTVFSTIQEEWNRFEETYQYVTTYVIVVPPRKKEIVI